MHPPVFLWRASWAPGVRPISWHFAGPITSLRAAKRAAEAQYGGLVGHPPTTRARGYDALVTVNRDERLRLDPGPLLILPLLCC